MAENQDMFYSFVLLAAATMKVPTHSKTSEPCVQGNCRGRTICLFNFSYTYWNSPSKGRLPAQEENVQRVEKHK